MWKPVSPEQSVFLANLTSYAKLFCCAQVYLKVGKPLVYAALNGYKGTLLTYGQTGTGNECNMTWLSARQNSAHVVAGFTLPLSFPAELGIECTPFADHLTKRNESFEQKNLTTLGRILYFQASSFFAAQWAQKNICWVEKRLGSPFEWRCVISISKNASERPNQFKTSKKKNSWDDC